MMINIMNDITIDTKINAININSINIISDKQYF